MGLEEAGPWGEGVEEEEVLLGAQTAVITLLGLLHSVLVVCHQLLVREGHAVHPLQQPETLFNTDATLSFIDANNTSFTYA